MPFRTLSRVRSRASIVTVAAACLALVAGPTAGPASAFKLYRDTTTGAIYSSPAEGRVEHKPFGLDIGFQFFLEYRTELEDRNQPLNTPYAAKNTTTAPYDQFRATRTIMDIRRSFTPTTRGRLVLDTRGSGSDYRAYIRHVIGEIDIPKMSGTLSFGEIGLPTTGYDDAFWGYRVQGTSFTEREGLMTAGDWGVGWNWKPSSLPVTWYTTFTNGEGRTTAEANIGKAVESRLTWKTPVNGLEVSGFGYYSQGGNFTNTPNTGVEIEQSRFGGGVYYKGPGFRIAVTGIVADDMADTYGNAILLLSNSTDNMNRQSVPTTNANRVNQMNSRGWSVMGVLDVPGTDWSVLGRYDYFRPGGEIEDNGHSRYIFGPAWKFNDNMTFVVAYEKLEFERAAITASGNLTANAFDQQRIQVLSEIRF